MNRLVRPSREVGLVRKCPHNLPKSVDRSRQAKLHYPTFPQFPSGLALKTYRSPRTLLAEVEHLLATNKPSFHHSPLEDVIDLLCRGRHYTWIGIYLAVGESGSQQLLGAGGNTEPAQVALPETRSKILVSIKLASRELGVLAVESNREKMFGAEHRWLFVGVADVRRQFFAASGKY